MFIEFSHNEMINYLELIKQLNVVMCISKAFIDPGIFNANKYKPFNIFKHNVSFFIFKI